MVESLTWRVVMAVRGVGPDGEPTVVLVTFGLAREGGVVARMCDSATRVPMPMVQRLVCPGSVTLRAAILAHTAVRGTSAAEPPRIRWPISGFRMTVPVTAVLLVRVLGAAVSLSLPLVLLGAIPLIGKVWWQRDGALLMLQPAVIEEGQLLPSQVMVRIRAEAELAGPSPLDRVDVVKAAYGRLLGDIVYRIENSALFDAAQPATSRFQVALASWDPGSVHADQLAQEVEVSFAAARSEAERLGMAHLPLTARGPAQRAVKAVRVALSDAPEAERTSAIARADETLRALALYYLPTVDRQTPSLIGARRAIEPAP